MADFDEEEDDDRFDVTGSATLGEMMERVRERRAREAAERGAGDATPSTPDLASAEETFAAPLPAPDPRSGEPARMYTEEETFAVPPSPSPEPMREMAIEEPFVIGSEPADMEADEIARAAENRALYGEGRDDLTLGELMEMGRDVREYEAPADGPPPVTYLADDPRYDTPDEPLREMAPDDMSDDEADITGSEVLPIDISTEARELLGVRGPRPGVDTDLVEPDWSAPLEETGGAMALASPYEPDADDAGGPSDMDEDDIRSTMGMGENAPSRVKSTPEDRPLEEPDFTGADWSDAIRRGLRGVFGALGAAGGGRPMGEFRSERDALQARIDARNAAKGEATRAYEETSAEQARFDADRASREAIAADREARLRDADDIRAALGMERADIARGRAEDYGRDVDSRVSSRAAETARTTARSTVDSPESVRARERLTALAANLPERGGLRERLAAEIAGREWTAEEVDRFLGREAPAWLRPYLGRGPDGGGPGVPSESLQAELARLGVAQSTIDAMTERQRRDLLDEMTGSMSAATRSSIVGSGDTLVAGVPMSMVTSTMSPGERADYHDTFATLRTADDSLDHLEEVAERAGLTAVIDPAVWAEIEPDLSDLASLVGVIRNIGVIQPSEMPGVRGALPDPTSVTGRTLGSFIASLRGWRRATDSLAAARIGVVTNNNPEAIRGALDFVHGGGGSGGGAAPAAEAAPTTGATVLFYDLNGDEVDVPAGEADFVESEMGWERAE